MINAAVDIYDRIATDLLPTPAKSHYVFNLRDLSKCIQGITQADSGTMRDDKTMMRLFYHECLRVFHDRLINVEDKSYFYFLMKELCIRHFGGGVVKLPDVPLITEPPLLLFGDFLHFGAEQEDRLYEELTDVDKIKSALSVNYSILFIHSINCKLTFIGLFGRFQPVDFKGNEAYIFHGCDRTLCSTGKNFTS